MNYWGQAEEDYHIHKTYFPSLRNGVFLEMGAMEGMLFSNTKFFEDTMGWTGVLIEPIPSSFAKLKVNRPNCMLFQYAVSSKQGKVTMYDKWATSSIKEHTSDNFYQAWIKDKNVQLIEVESRRLDSILHDAGIKHIDFWSLDVEGSEIEALNTMDWSIPVGLICIETQEGNKKALCDEVLTRNGFQFRETFKHNEIWTNPNNMRI